MDTEPDRKPRVGDHVIFHDPVGAANNAIVICVFANGVINMVMAESDKEKDDSYGRQIKRETSVSYKIGQAHGFYWRYPDDEPNQYREPLET